MQSLTDQKKELEESIAAKEKAIAEREQSLAVDKALLKADKTKLKIIEEAMNPTPPKPKKEKVENALSKDQKETR